MRGSARVFWTTALLAALPLRAEEKSAPAAGANETSISAAKREFDAVKAAREAALQQKGDVPRIATPELQTGADNAPRPWAEKKKDELLEKQKKGKSDNWLIEAIEKEKLREKAVAAGRDPEAALAEPANETRESATGEKTDALTASLTGEKSDTTSGKEKEKDRDARALSTVNPLTRYMSDWMTPQDFALLQSTGAGAKDGAPAAGGTAGQALALPNATTAAATSSGGLEASLTGLGLGGGTKSGAPATPRENPFLQGLGSSGASSLTFTPPAALTPPPAPPTPTTSIFVPPTPEPAPVRSNIPDFAKPADDAKALKPLKRF